MTNDSTFIPFMHRRLLAQKCDDWIQKNGALPCTFTVISFLVSREMLKLDDVLRVIREDADMEVSSDES